MSSNVSEAEETGTYWLLSSERRRPKREFPNSTPTKKAETRPKSKSPVPNTVVESAEKPEEEVPSAPVVTEVVSEPTPVVQAPLPHLPDNSPEMLSTLSNSGEPVLEESQPIEVEHTKCEEKDEEPKHRPVTRRMARSSGEEVWPWMNSAGGTYTTYNDDEFVVDDAAEVETVKVRGPDGLEPPRSMNYLDPTRESAKKARQSALELLKQSRQTKTQRSSENILTNTEAPRLPIFDLPESEIQEEQLLSSSTTQTNDRHSNSAKVTSIHHHVRSQEALEVKKRKRHFEAPIGDFLPAYGPDFIVDDGSGYGVDPLYRTPHEEGRIQANKFGQKSSTSLPTSSSPSAPRSASINNLSTTDEYLDDSSRGSSSAMPGISNLSNLSFPRPSPSPSAMKDVEFMTKVDDVGSSTVMSERSNPASLGGGSSASTTRTAPTDTMIASKLRLTVLVNKEKLFISCPDDSNFGWLQAAAVDKYRQVTRMEIELSHLETNFGSRLFPNDKIHAYMNDLETVVAIIKEAKPLGLVALYRADCLSLSLAENEKIIERFSVLDAEESLSGGAHEVLPLHALSLDHATLPTLSGVFSLHSFVRIDLSANHITSAALHYVLQEISKSIGLESSANFREIKLAENLLGLSVDADVPFRAMLGRFSSLTSLDFSDNCMNDSAASMFVSTVLEKCTKLTDLNLSSNLFGVRAIESIAKDAIGFKNLISLNLARNPLREEGFCCLIRAFGENPPLKSLDLSYCNIFTSLRRKTSTTSNQTNEAPIPSLETTIEAIGSKLLNLTRLSLRGCKFDTWEYPMLLPSLCLALKRVQYLDMADCSLTAHDLRYLKNILNNASFSHIDLSYNNLSSENRLALEFMAAAPTQQKMKIVMRECFLNDEKERILGAVSSRPTLTVDLIGN